MFQNISVSKNKELIMSVSKTSKNDDKFLLNKVKQMKKVLVKAVHGYQRWISPALPPACRYYPTCSNYMIQAIEKHGPAKGLAMGTHFASQDMIQFQTILVCEEIGQNQKKKKTQINLSLFYL